MGCYYTASLLSWHMTAMKLVLNTNETILQGSVTVSRCSGLIYYRQLEAKLDQNKLVISLHDVVQCIE